MTFVEALGKELFQRGLSRREMARGVGISPSSVNAWFSSQNSDPSVETARRICHNLGLTIEELIAKYEPYRSGFQPQQLEVLTEESSSYYGGMRNHLSRLIDRLTDDDLQDLVALAESKLSRARAKESQSGSGS
jgi:transcriptional regulator with XRE-family HTH domain